MRQADSLDHMSARNNLTEENPGEITSNKRPLYEPGSGHNSKRFKVNSFLCFFAFDFPPKILNKYFWVGLQWCPYNSLQKQAEIYAMKQIQISRLALNGLLKSYYITGITTALCPVQCMQTMQCTWSVLYAESFNRCRFSVFITTWLCLQSSQHADMELSDGEEASSPGIEVIAERPPPPPEDDEDDDIGEV